MTKKNEAIPLTNYCKIHLKEINEPNFVVRNEFDKIKLDELALSIKKFGLIEPIIVMKVKDKYEIVAGHRRYKACKLNLMNEIDCKIIDTDKGKHEIIKLHENLLREEVNVIDEAKFLNFIMKKNKMKQKELAKMIGQSDAYVSLRLQILEYDKPLIQAIQNDEITFTVAKELQRIDDKNVREEYTNHAIRSGVTSQVAKGWADSYLIFKDKPNNDNNNGNGYDVNVAKQTIMVQCFVTKEMFPIEETGTYRISIKAMKEMDLLWKEQKN